MTRATDVAVLVAIVFGYSLDAQIRPQPTPRTLARFSASIEDLARASSPAVVQISVQGRAPLEEGGAQQAGFTADQRTTGSGVIVDPAVRGSVLRFRATSCNGHMRVFARTGGFAAGRSASFPRTSASVRQTEVQWREPKVIGTAGSSPSSSR
jgi:hypothetical protein